MNQWHCCNIKAQAQNDVVSVRCHGALWMAHTGGKHEFEQGKGNWRSNTHSNVFFTMNNQKIPENWQELFLTKRNNPYTVRTVSTCTSWIYNLLDLILNTQSKSNEKSLHIKSSKPDFSHDSQPNQKLWASC